MSTRTWLGTTDTAWTTATNWSGGAVPVAGDDVVFDYNATRSIAGYDASGTSLNSFRCDLTFGSSAITLGSNGTPLKLTIGSGGAVQIGLPSQSTASASGSQRVNLDLAASNCVCTVYGTAGTSADAGKEPTRLRMSNSSATLNVLGGTVGLATDNAGDTSTVGAVNVKSGATLNLGSGVTVTSATNNGATLSTRAAVPTLETLGGTTNAYGSGLLGTVNAVGGTTNIFSRTSTGASITTLNMRGGVLDVSGNGQAITIAGGTFRSGTLKTFSDTQVTFTANLALDTDGSRTSFTLSSN